MMNSKAVLKRVVQVLILSGFALYLSATPGAARLTCQEFEDLAYGAYNGQCDYGVHHTVCDCHYLANGEVIDAACYFVCNPPI